ncbi:MAG: hypothetical protein ACXWNB_08040, partial [Candidatus Binataceae bacterium]
MKTSEGASTERRWSRRYGTAIVLLSAKRILSATSAALHRLLPPQLMYSAGCEAVMDTNEQSPPEF